MVSLPLPLPLLLLTAQVLALGSVRVCLSDKMSE
jgi:hypothetical protein